MKNKIAYHAAVLIMLFYMVCGVTIAAGIYTNGFESVRTLYAKTGGAVIKTAVIVDSEFTTFELKNAGFAADKWGDYTIEIALNPQYEANYYVNGVRYTIPDYEPADEEPISVSSAILTRKINGGFMLKCPGSSFAGALESFYKSDDVKVEEATKGTPPFIVTLTAESGKDLSFLIGFKAQ